MSVSDDYVISLLQKDAQATSTSIRNANRSRPNAPKPNTRFLQNIIRDTNSHNAALKAKEEEESRQRLRQLRNGGSDRDIGRDDRKRARDGNDSEEDEARRKQKSVERPGRWAQAFGGLDGKSGVRRERGHDRREGRESKAHETKRDRSDDRGARRRSSRDRQSSRDRHSKHHRRNHRSRERSRSPRPREQRDRSRDDRRRSPVADSRAYKESHQQTKSTKKSYSSDSDPLEDIIGPKPAAKIRPRGRGANRTSTMDSRFREDYDPRTDVSMEPTEDDNDDWDMALEALRDRTKWKMNNAERLRAAGFTEDEIAMASKPSKLNRASGSERDIEDVKWSTKGQAREWDRGKVLDEQGAVDIKAGWTK